MKEASFDFKQSVLVVDDSLEMLILRRTVLEMEGFEVFTAQSGTEALRVLSTIADPDLILLDYQMDEMNGTDFINELERSRPEITKEVPVVFLSGMDEIAGGKAMGFIPKAVGVDMFLERVHHFIERGRSLVSETKHSHWAHI